MILNLSYKPRCREAMVSVDTLTVSLQGVRHAANTPQIRHVLIVPHSTLIEFRLQPGDLRENIVLDDSEIGDLHGLPSGTVLNINGVLIRLTVHCEPCGRLAHIVANPKALEHKRGYLGTFLVGGRLCVGDPVRVEGKQYETIPYELRERIVWYLSKRHTPVPATVLVRDIGLSNSYCRALPNLIKGLGVEKMIVFGSPLPTGFVTPAKHQEEGTPVAPFLLATHAKSATRTS